MAGKVVWSAVGKTALLLAMLGELNLPQGSVRGRGRVAYVPQMPWLMAASFRHAHESYHWIVPAPNDTCILENRFILLTS